MCLDNTAQGIQCTIDFMNVFEWADYENPSTLLVWIYLLNDKKFVVVEIQISVIIWYFTTIVKLNGIQEIDFYLKMQRKSLH